MSSANLKILEAVPGHSKHSGPTVREYIAIKVADIVQTHQIRESGHLPKKHAVEKPGLQDDGTWILGSGLFLNDEGEEMDPKQIKLCVDKPSTPG